jgi:ABC-type sugar transport system, periplasmic component
MKKGMSKVIGLSVVVVFFTLSLVAYGKDAPVTLKLWHQWVSKSDAMSQPFREVLDSWNKTHPDIKIEDEGIDGEAYKTKIKVAIAANEAPDIFYAWGAGFAKPFVDSGNVLALDKYLNDGTKKRLLDGALTNFTYNGKVYGLPCTLALASLYCNKDLFDKNGIKIPTTFDELLSAVKAFRAKDITPIVVGEKDTWPGMYWYDILALRTAGSQGCLNALSKKASFDQPAFTDAAAKLGELLKAKAFNDSMFSIGYNEMVADFTQGKAAMCFQGNWIGGACETDNAPVNGKIIAVPFPMIKGGKGNINEFFGGASDGLWVNANSKYKKQAVKALKYITENCSNKFYAAGAGLPCWSVSGVDESKLSPLTKQTAAMIKNAQGFVMWWDILLDGRDAETHKNLVVELFYNKISPQDFSKEMQKLNLKK